MEKINAVITGIGGYVPDYVLNNQELSRMVDTNDEWIMTRVGIKERRILTEEGIGTSYMARKAAKQLLKKTGFEPDLLQYGGNIFAIGFPTSFAFAELSAARQQSIGVFAFVACCFADFVKHFNPLFPVSCSI